MFDDYDSNDLSLDGDKMRLTTNSDRTHFQATPVLKDGSMVIEMWEEGAWEADPFVLSAKDVQQLFIHYVQHGLPKGQINA